MNREEELALIIIGLNIKNNTNYPQSVNLMGNNSNLLDTANAKREFRWDFTTFVFTDEFSVSLQYKPNAAASFSIYTAELQSQTLEAIVISLNQLGIGYFTLYNELGNTYIGTYNDNYEFGQLVISGSSLVNYIITEDFRFISTESGELLITE
jgi:hypothetical protein